MTHEKQFDFKIFWKSQLKFSNLMREKGKDIFFIFEIFMENMKIMQCMKFLDQNMWCMQECYECQDEHQEHYECQDWTPRTLWMSRWTSYTQFWKIFNAKKTCKTPNLEFFNA